MEQTDTCVWKLATLIITGMYNSISEHLVCKADLCTNLCI